MQQRRHDIRGTNTAFYGDLRTQIPNLFKWQVEQNWQQGLSNHHSNHSTLMIWTSQGKLIRKLNICGSLLFEIPSLCRIKWDYFGESGKNEKQELSNYRVDHNLLKVNESHKEDQGYKTLK